MERSSVYISEPAPEFLNIAQISHEIRNPLTLINCTLQLLDYRYPQLKTDDLWNQLSEDVEYLKQLTLSLSDYNHCSRLTYTMVNLNSVLNNIIGTYLPLAQSQNKHLLLSIASELPVIACDEIKIRQVLINLLKNAFEATSEGESIEVTADCNTKRVIISVKDTGKGISEDQLSKIFQPFVTEKEGGTGLGLAITQKIIAAHKGSVRVYSRERIGTKFIISLPLNQKQIQDQKK